MKFLDLTGLTHFYEKLRASFVKTKGASVINMDNDNEGLNVKKVGSSNTFLVPSGFISYNIKDDGQSEKVAQLQFGDLILKKIHIINGTSSQILIADGSTKTINAANGICGLDSNGNVPLSQLGNLDTTVAEAVTALPTTNIKKHIYLIKDASGVSQNQYEEYIYTGDTSATYDASKWEKLGDFRATVDLADYAKKNQVANDLFITPYEDQVILTLFDINGGEIDDNVLGKATSTQAGVMTSSDKKKLDGIANNANNYSLPTASSTIKGGITLGYSQSGKNYPVVLDSNGKAYVNVPWIDTNTTYDLSPYAKKVETVDFSTIRLDKAVIDKTPQGLIEKQVILFNSLGDESVSIEFEEAASNMSGFMSMRDKNKLDTVAYKATADESITIAEVDSLFA